MFEPSKNLCLTVVSTSMIKLLSCFHVAGRPTTDYAQSLRTTRCRPALSRIPSGVTPPQSSFPSTPGVRAYQPSAKPVNRSLVSSSCLSGPPAPAVRGLVLWAKTGRATTSRLCRETKEMLRDHETARFPSADRQLWRQVPRLGLIMRRKCAAAVPVPSSLTCPSSSRPDLLAPLRWIRCL
jgi:hypothetical protein